MILLSAQGLDSVSVRRNPAIRATSAVCSPSSGGVRRDASWSAESPTAWLTMRRSSELPAFHFRRRLDVGCTCRVVEHLVDRVDRPDGTSARCGVNPDPTRRVVRAGSASRSRVQRRRGFSRFCSPLKSDSPAYPGGPMPSIRGARSLRRSRRCSCAVLCLVGRGRHAGRWSLPACPGGTPVIR